jgi:iron complex outermembrane receptor protein
MLRLAALILLLGIVPVSLAGQDTAPADSATTTRVFTLGEIVVIGTREGGIAAAGASEIDERRIHVFGRATVDEAVNLAPGVVGGFFGNSRRNEPNIFVRGQDRWRVPFYMDGVRIYLPADNRIDFARFLTAHLSAIQIQKGYASVLDGPGAMGGAINIVTRKPTRPFESEVGLSFGGRSELEDWTGYLSAGARRERFYAQAGLTYSDRDSWSLSDDYAPAAGSLQGPGERLGSWTRDSNFNLKVGFTPNATDEYAVNLAHQEGEKSGLLDVYNNPPPIANSYWKWPRWDMRTVALLTNTRIGSASYLRAKIYSNSFGNTLYTYDDLTYTTQELARASRIFFDDRTIGGSLELGTNVSDSNSLKAAFHYRDDVHVENQQTRPTHPRLALTDPEQTQSQAIWALALENTYHASPSFDVIAGASYESYKVTRSEEYVAARGLFEYERGGASGISWQAAGLWRQSAARQLHASVSSRTRFPGLWELYSTRFGSATPNPNLGAERSTNFEIGWSEERSGGARVSADVFYSDLVDLIQSVPLEDGSVQPQNVGGGRFYGLELSADVPVSPTITMGGHYGFIDREIVDEVHRRQRRAAGLPELRMTDVPPHAGLLYSTWRPVQRLSVTSSIEYQSDRWTDVTAVNTEPEGAWPIPQIETGAHTLLDLLLDVSVRQNVTLSVGAKNLLDEYYELVWGLPQAGRSFYATMRMGL